MTSQAAGSFAAAEREGFIEAMRGVASSVTVVTTDGPAGRHGATVSAFSSVSADPPMVLVCLRADTRIARAVTGNGAFCVNVLPDCGEAIARRFAGARDDLGADRFEGVPIDACAGHPPALARSTAFSCRLREVVRSGTHGIFLGEVAAIRRASADPLVYLRGGYHRPVPLAAAAEAERC